MNRPIDSEIASSRTIVCAAKSTPSTVASNGPSVNRTVVPGLVKTLTRTTDIAIGSDSNTEARMSWRLTPAAPASRSMTALRTIGPR